MEPTVTHEMIDRRDGGDGEPEPPILEEEIRHAAIVRAPPERVYDAFTTAEGLDGWFTSGAAVDASPGGRIRFRWRGWGADRIDAEDHGTVVEARRPERFVFTWSPDDPSYVTTVTIEMEPVAEGTVVRLRERGYRDTPSGRSRMLDCASGWGEALALCARHLEAPAGAAYLRSARSRLLELKAQAERAMAQVDDEAFFARLDPEANSIAVLVKHTAGNMRSRWTDFLSSDGEKPDRDRDAEFEIGDGDDRAALTAAWDDGWARVLEAIDALKAADLTREVRIRGEPHTAVDAINRQLAHYGHHVGQIVLLAKHHAGAGWETLSIPRRRPGGGANRTGD